MPVVKLTFVRINSDFFYCFNVSDLKLFNKMILVSGNVLTIPLDQRNSVDTAIELGHRLGYRGRNREHLLKFFKSLPAEDLTEAMNAYYLELKMVGIVNTHSPIYSYLIKDYIQRAFVCTSFKGNATFNFRMHRSAFRNTKEMYSIFLFCRLYKDIPRKLSYQKNPKKCLRKRRNCLR